MQRTPDQVWT